MIHRGRESDRQRQRGRDTRDRLRATHTDTETERQTKRDREGDRDTVIHRERTQNSELYYSRTETLGSSLLLQSVLSKLRRQLHIITKVVTDTFKTHTV